MKSALIAGGGFYGCSAAHQLTIQGGWDVTLIEKGSNLGIGNYTNFYGDILIHLVRDTFTQNEDDMHTNVTSSSLLHDHIFQTYVERMRNFMIIQSTKMIFQDASQI